MDYFNERKNVIYQRTLFNCCIQKEGESIDDFITDLHKLAKDCNCRNSREEMIRESWSTSERMRLSERMQLQDNLDYKRTIEMARSYETKKNEILQQSRELHQGTTVDSATNRIQVKGKKNIQKKTGSKSWII